MALTEKQIQQAKTSGSKIKLTDGNGLTLYIHSKGGKYWVHRYYLNKKRVEFNLGTYPTLSLREARLKHSNNRVMISKGVDPKEEKSKEKNTRAVEASNTFRSIAEKYFKDSYMPATAASTWKKIIPYFDKDIYPYKKLGSKPIQDITPLEIYEACKKISDRGSKESAKRVCRMISSIYAWATLLGLVNVNIAYGLAKSLPKHTKSNYNSVTNPNEFAKVLKKIDAMPNHNPLIKVYLQLMPLVFSRQSELRAMRWDEVDLVKNEWAYVVGKTIKETNGKPHTVPLSNQAAALIKSLIPFKTTSPYVFYSDKSESGFMSDSAISRHLRACGVSQEETSLHGFRASARTICDEVLEIRTDVLEVGLSHKNPTDRHGGAYSRAEFKQQRIVAMQQWADYCDGLKNK